MKIHDSVNITKGVKKSLIYDTDNGFLQFIPNTMLNIILNQKTNYSVLKEKINDEDYIIIEEYINFITDNNLGFFVESEEELNKFVYKPYFVESPSNIEYFIIDFKNSDFFNKSLINEIIFSKIKYIQLRFSNQLNYTEISEILENLKLLNDSCVNEISIILKYSDELFRYFTENKGIITSKLLDIVFHSGSEKYHKEFSSIRINIIENIIFIPESCGSVLPKNFNLNRTFSLESMCKNSCLHKKISIDAEGNIRNCPSMPQSFGNIKDTTLEEALNHKDFKKYWNLTKDRIEVCKDCEFRYICTDCRAYTERTHTDKDGLDTSKPLKCGYNPYTGEWEEWSTNPLKQKAIQYYGMQDLVKK
ncbi:grasp-with-spasm system SPASM domain peptide maturase [Amniculibacterium aquaticum]|uniref:grasp-with-spasm system SPASM domain peptide maturase n=1 Tax=Amniculibacterium aquaticum TaxID=2479858 RepID=UPI0013DD9B9D|nr:grasp-with-spasm system SPASM domain peptide maturase [Amniculibacterium aquaticum]